MSNEQTLSVLLSEPPIEHPGFGQPRHVDHSQRQIQDSYPLKAETITKCGTAQACIGVLSISLSLITILLGGSWVHGGGIWTGIFVLITGLLCNVAASNPTTEYCITCSALVMCFISVVLLIFGLSFNLFMCWIMIVPDNTIKDHKTRITLAVAILMIIALPLTICSLIYVGRRICSRGYNLNQAASTYTDNVPMLDTQHNQENFSLPTGTPQTTGHSSVLRTVEREFV